MLLAAGAGALAHPLTPSEALGRALNETGKRNIKAAAAVDRAPVYTLTGTDNKASLYVFNSGTGGFLIVSADDCAYPLLGYSDTCSFNAAAIPPQLKGWLEFYGSQIQQASAKGISLKSSEATPESDGKAAILPLIETKWDQGAPYNDDCPMDGSDRSVTGCVATAMAQAMYFHQWPATGQGSHSYTWNDQTLSVDFASVTYDWSAMTPTYDSSSSDSAKAAVATLMYNCGVSVDMNYSSDESGASSMTMVQALYKYFNYDKSMTFPQRSYYGQDEWENMVYDQLSQGLPVLYCGQSDDGGHQFICDGYDGSGYFHFNWGWSGMSDGYYLLSALNPLDQGIGGSGSDSGFNYDQGIVLNMKPAQAGSTVTPLIYCYGNFSTKATSAVKLGDSVEFDGDYFNFACSDISGYVGVKLTDSEGNATYLRHGDKYGFGAFSGYAGYTVTLPSDLADGQYVVTPAFLPDGSDGWVPILCPLSGIQSLSLTVSDGEATFADIDTNTISITDFKVNSPIYFGEDFSVSFTMTNTGTTEYFGEYLLYLVDQNGDGVDPAADINSIDLQPGESVSVNYISKFADEVSTDEGTEEVPAGDYYLAVVTHFTKRELYLSSEPVNVQAAPSQTSLTITGLTVNGGNEVVDPTNVSFKGTVECTEGYFGGKLKVAVFKADSDETNISGNTDYIFVSEGEQADFTATVDISKAGDETNFFAVVFDGSKQISNPYSFSIESLGISTPGVEGALTITVTPDNVTVNGVNGLASVCVYSIDGTLLSEIAPSGATEATLSLTPLKGELLVTATDTSGHTASRLLLR